MAVSINRGLESKPYKVIIYGHEGIGKSTFAAQFPSPIFADIENGTGRIDVNRFTPAASTWDELLEQIDYLIATPDTGFKTLVIDSADWAEKLCSAFTCKANQKTSIESFAYGKGWKMMTEHFQKLLNKLDTLRLGRDMHIVFTAHSAMRKFEQPDQSGAYDRYELKLYKDVAGMLKEWADMVLFVNFETIVVKDENDKAKAKGAKRVMYTSHNACWDAKNRDGLNEKLPFSYSEIEHLIPAQIRSRDRRESEELKAQLERLETDEAPAKLKKLMDKDAIALEQVRDYVYSNFSAFPHGTLIKDMDPEFIDECLIGNWAEVSKTIFEESNELPF